MTSHKEHSLFFLTVQYLNLLPEFDSLKTWWLCQILAFPGSLAASVWPVTLPHPKMLAQSTGSSHHAACAFSKWQLCPGIIPLDQTICKVESFRSRPRDKDLKTSSLFRLCPQEALVRKLEKRQKLNSEHVTLWISEVQSCCDLWKIVQNKPQSYPYWEMRNLKYLFSLMNWMVVSPSEFNKIHMLKP